MDKNQLAFAPSSLILARNILDLNRGVGRMYGDKNRLILGEMIVGIVSVYFNFHLYLFNKPEYLINKAASKEKKLKLILPLCFAHYMNTLCTSSTFLIR